MVFLWFTNIKSHSTTIFPWFSYGLPTLNPIQPPFSYGFPMVFLWFSHDISLVPFGHGRSFAPSPHRLRSREQVEHGGASGAWCVKSVKWLGTMATVHMVYIYIYRWFTS